MTAREFGSLSFHQHRTEAPVPAKAKTTVVERWDGKRFVEVLLTWDEAQGRFVEAGGAR